MTDTRATALTRSLDRLGAATPPATPALGSHVQEPATNYTPDEPFRSGHVIAITPEEGTGEPLLEVLDRIETWGEIGALRKAVTHTLRLSDIDARLTVPARDTSAPFAAHVDAALANAATAHGAMGRARKPSAKRFHRDEWRKWFALVVRLVSIEEEVGRS